LLSITQHDHIVVVVFRAKIDMPVRRTAFAVIVRPCWCPRFALAIIAAIVTCALVPVRLCLGGKEVVNSSSSFGEGLVPWGGGFESLTVSSHPSSRPNRAHLKSVIEHEVNVHRDIGLAKDVQLRSADVKSETLRPLSTYLEDHKEVLQLAFG